MIQSRNLQAYQLIDALALSTEQLDKFRSVPISETQARRIGWTTPAGSLSDQLLHEVSGHQLITMHQQERLLPGAVVADALDEKVQQVTADQGYPPGRRDKLAMKERVVEELLPRAFIRHKRTHVWIDSTRQRICVMASSTKEAETALDLLRETLGSLKVVPLAPQTPAGRTMTAWLTDSAVRPQGITIGDRVTLRAKGDDGKIAATAIDPDGEEIRISLEVGRQVSQMALTLEERASFMLHEDMSIKSIRLADAVLKDADNVDDEDPLARFESDFVIAASVLSDSVEILITALGGPAEISPASST